jgi:hypothetical protein
MSQDLQEVSADGNTITNRAEPGHIFYPGTVVRTFSTVGFGRSYVSTRGYGSGGYQLLNQFGGPAVFRNEDKKIRDEVKAAGPC